MLDSVQDGQTFPTRRRGVEILNEQVSRRQCCRKVKAVLSAGEFSGGFLVRILFF